MSKPVAMNKMPALSLSLKRSHAPRRNSFIDESMPKRKKSCKVNMSDISPSKKQALITNYTSPLKNNRQVDSVTITPVKNSEKKDTIVKCSSSCNFTLESKSNLEDVIDLCSQEPSSSNNCDSELKDVIMIEDSVSSNNSASEKTLNNNVQKLGTRNNTAAKKETLQKVDITPVKSPLNESNTTPLKETPPKVGNLTPVKSPLNESNTTPNKTNGFVSPYKRNALLSQTVSPSEAIKFSPKIKRRPGKYFDPKSMPENLIKSPAKPKTPEKKNTKKNLMKHFEKSPGQTKINTLSLQNNKNPLNDMSYFKEFPKETWEALDQLANDNEAMEEIRRQNSSRAETSNVSNDAEVSGNSSVSCLADPPKSEPTKTAPTGNFISVVDYLIGNPMISCADERQVLDCSELNNMREALKQLSGPCQQLCCKMFSRSPLWYRVEIDLVKKYEKLGDVNGLVATLLEQGFVTNDLHSAELLDLMRLLKAPELKTICNYFKIYLGQGNAMKKNDMIEAILNHACSQRVLFGNLSEKIKARVIKELGHCIRLNTVFSEMFNLLVVLATYPYHIDEEKKRFNGLETRLKGPMFHKSNFPAYVFRPDVAFKDINHLNDYAVALSFKAEYYNLVENKNWDRAAEMVIDAKLRFELFLRDQSNIELVERLGGHLMKFTAGYHYGSCMSNGISILKKDPKHSEVCVEVIEQLLAQIWFLVRKRGFWYDELALLHQTKSKNLESACRAVKTGLEDNRVNLIWRRALSQRAASLIKRKSFAIDGLKAELKALMVTASFQPDSLTITAKCLEGVAGRKKTYIRALDDGQEYCSVEEIVINYFKTEASTLFTEARHDEGRILVNVILACFYDVIYLNPEGESMFHCQMQSQPLDWGGTHFYTRRQQQIQDVLDRLRTGGIHEIMITLQNICSCSEGESSIVNWDYLRLQELPKIKELLECLTSEVFVNIAEHVIKDYKTYSSGLPDLTLWNPSTRQCMLVEVKGPNDKLSTSQTVWLENLNRFGARVLVCHVETMGSRNRMKT